MPESTCLIDGFGPLPLVQPPTASAIGELVRQAAAQGQALYPLGGQTCLNYGLPPSKPGLAVDLRPLNQVIDYPARDMTITVQAGITLAKLRDILAPENQQLPIDIPRAAEATLGGALAANISGLRRFGHGTLRDYVLGISAINDEGQEFKGGGRVVKNVAGYDMCKLFVGSLGTLGILTQATLKVRPRPEEQAVISVGCHHAHLDQVLEQVSQSRTRPVGLDLLNRAAAAVVHPQGGLVPSDAPWEVVVAFEGNADAVKWQVQQLVMELKRGPLEARLSTTAQPLLQALTDLPAWPKAQLSLQATVLPEAVASFCCQVDAVSPPVWLQAHAGNGIVRGHFGPDLTMALAATTLNTWRDLAARVGGRVVVLQCPSAWKKTLSVWGPPGSDVWLMRQIKDKLDPHYIFNPGRFVDGI